MKAGREQRQRLAASGGTFDTALLQAGKAAHQGWRTTPQPPRKGQTRPFADIPCYGSSGLEIFGKTQQLAELSFHRKGRVDLFNRMLLHGSTSAHSTSRRKREGKAALIGRKVRARSHWLGLRTGPVEGAESKAFIKKAER